MRNGFKFESLFYENVKDPILLNVLENIQNLRTKLAAAFARIRVEHQAIGENYEERLQNVLSKPNLTKEKEIGICAFKC